MADVQKKLQELSEGYQKLQGELSTAVEARQRLESQQQENSTVQKEFALLADDANIYKQIGPVLLKQDKAEAVMAVNARLEFITKEIQRFENQINEIQNKSEIAKTEIIQIQSALQQAQGAAS